MDIAIINPGNHRALFQDLSETYTAIEPPVWAGLISGHLLKKGRSLELIDQPGLGWDDSKLVNEASGLNPRVIAVVVYGHQPSASTQSMTAAYSLVSKIKSNNPDQKVALLGGHPSALPAQTLKESEVDFVIKGEGHISLDLLLSVKDFNDSNQLDSVPGLWRKKGLEIVAPKKPAPLTPAKTLDDALPGLPWSRLPMKSYRAHNWHCFENINDRSPYAAIYTSLGCPYRCTFCCINAPFEKHLIRHWSPEFVVSEMELLVKEYGVKNLKISDEMFVLKRSQIEAISRLIIEKGLDLNIWAYARVDTVHEDLLDLMRQAGFKWLCLGIESSSTHVRDGAAKNTFTQSDIYSVVRKIQNAGISVIGNFIFGLPDDDLSSMKQTLDLAMDLNLEFSNFYSAMAYPGSQLYKIAVEKGWPLPEGWHNYSQHAFESLPLPTDRLTGGQVLAFRDYAWEKYFKNPDYLKFLEQRFGTDTRDHIKNLTKVSLKRKYADQSILEALS